MFSGGAGKGVTGIKVTGRTGRHAQINGTYEPSQQSHNGKPVWISRSVQPVYFFHTGKARWVISKRVDDGSKCYAFTKDKDAADPSATGNPLVCCDDDGEWRADAKVSIMQTPAGNDKFMQLRMTLDGELDKLGIKSEDQMKSLWKRLDYNGNNIVSLAEIDKMVVEMVSGGTWPAWLNNKPALMRAYKKTINEDNGDGDWVHKHQFHGLMLNIFWFNKLFQIFQVMDGNDRRMDIREFTAGMSQLGLNLSGAEATEEFNKMDSNHGGQVLFVEFCAYVRKRVNPDANPNFDADIVSGEHCMAAVRKHHGHKSTHAHMVTRKTMSDFDACEKKMKVTIADNSKLKDLWHHLDFNGNRIVSLAEIDKFAVEKFPVLNHKPALMRAYKATIGEKRADGTHGGSHGDDWVYSKDFKKLLTNLFYFNKIYWIFNKFDGDDRRLTFDEFKKCLTLCASGHRMSEQEIKSDFQKVDRNGGGIILFDEFCRYFTQKACPEGLTDMVD